LAIENATLEWVAADVFTTDSSYDRPADQKRINKLAEEWMPGAMGAVLSSYREDEGQHYLIDGQHRIGALLRLGRKTDLVPAVVYHGLTIAEEAELFVWFNKNRKALSPSELFYASIAENNAGAIEIKQVVDGLELELDSFGTKPNSVRCVQAIWRIYNAIGPAGLDSALSIPLVTWGTPFPHNAYNERLLGSIARLLHYYENKIDLDHLRMTLVKEEPDKWLNNAAALRSLQGGDRIIAMCETIITAYNKGRSPSQKLDPANLRQKKDVFKQARKFQRKAKEKAA